MPDNGNRKHVLEAAVAALVILLTTGLGYRSLAHYLSRPSGSAPLPRGALKRLPLEIDNWQGKDVPIDEWIVRAADTDAHISRTYFRPTGARRVQLWVAYGIRGRDLLPHRPEVCYPGAGWTLHETVTDDLLLADGSRIQCRIYTFSQAGLGTRTMTVLNYYIVDGQYCPDASLLRSKAWRGQNAIRYMAQVQIACSEDLFQGAEAAGRNVRAFAVASGPAIRDLFPDRQTASPAEKPLDPGAHVGFVRSSQSGDLSPSNRNTHE